jgi:pimeloyl-ACP methyl ester carboxylesterase
MRELLDPELVATDCIRSFVLPQYQTIIDDLGIFGFQEADQTLVIAAYDWRKSIEHSAQTLSSRLAEVRQQYGKDVEVSLLGHSMGGLVSRYFLESGQFNGSGGYGNVKRLITLGTPHRGAPIAIPLVLGWEKYLFLSSDQVRLLASDPRYPGPYQLLPRPGELVAWDGSAATGVPVLDIYDPGVAGRLNLVMENLQAAKAFHASLPDGQLVPQVRYFSFGGNRQTTAAYVRLQRKPANRLDPIKIEQEDAGDGTVPIWSCTLPGQQFLYVAGSHGTLYQTYQLRQILGTLLGWQGVLLAGGPTEIALRNLVVEPSAPVFATLKLSAETTEMRGRIVVETLGLDPSGALRAGREVAAYPMAYEGPVIETILTVVPAPASRGHYQVSFYSEGIVTPSISVELIVQEQAP